MNTNKLVKWNLSQPFHKRVSAAEIQTRTETAREIADNNSLFRKIHAESQAKLAKTLSWENVE